MVNVDLPDGYPDDCTDADIKEGIDYLRKSLANDNYAISSVMRYMPLMSLGQSELARRDSTRVIRHSKVVSSVSAGIAVVALVISIMGTRSSSKWEAKQIDILQDIRQSGLDGVSRAAEHASAVEAISGRLDGVFFVDLDSPSTDGDAGRNESEGK